MTRWTALALAFATAGCANFGTKVTEQAHPGAAVRAIDQEILSEAVDQAFAALAVPQYKAPEPPPPPTAPAPPPPPSVLDGAMAPPPPAPTPAPPPPAAPAMLTGYVEVQSTMAIPDEIRRYAAARAATAAGSAGIGIREVRRVWERRGDGSWMQLYEDYPDTDVKVIVMVAYAGVDEVLEPFELRHTDRRGTSLKGRFKATFAIVPRKANMRAFSEVISGEARYELDEVKFYDAR